MMASTVPKPIYLHTAHLFIAQLIQAIYQLQITACKLRIYYIPRIYPDQENSLPQGMVLAVIRLCPMVALQRLLNPPSPPQDIWPWSMNLLQCHMRDARTLPGLVDVAMLVTASAAWLILATMEKRCGLLSNSVGHVAKLETERMYWMTMRGLRRHDVRGLVHEITFRFRRRSGVSCWRHESTNFPRIVRHL